MQHMAAGEVDEGLEGREWTPAATLSVNGRYRYELTRYWDSEDPSAVCWIMLNPSTADAVQDDPTIRRCIGFSKAWGFGSLVVVNLFGLRATNPGDLIDSAEAGIDPTGNPTNDSCLHFAAHNAGLVICAWGTGGVFLGQAARVTEALSDVDLYCLGLTKDGHPRHPLYVKGDVKPVLYRSTPR